MDAHAKHGAIIKRDQVRLAEPEARGRVRAPLPAAAGPRARLVTLESGVQAFEFTCSCGEVSLIEIQYDDKP